MSNRLPKLRGKELIKALQTAGFSVKRVKGSHHFVSHPDGRATVIPVHAGEVLGSGLLLKILRDLELDRDQLNALL